MTQEHEVLTAKLLREMGCPFGVTDPSATIWLEGRIAGVKAGFRDAARALNIELPGITS